jgi:hypothetical protein
VLELVPAQGLRPQHPGGHCRLEALNHLGVRGTGRGGQERGVHIGPHHGSHIEQPGGCLRKPGDTPVDRLADRGRDPLVGTGRRPGEKPGDLLDEEPTVRSSAAVG